MAKKRVCAECNDDLAPGTKGKLCPECKEAEYAREHAEFSIQLQATPGEGENILNVIRDDGSIVAVRILEVIAAELDSLGVSVGS